MTDDDERDKLALVYGYVDPALCLNGNTSVLAEGMHTLGRSYQ